MKTAMTIGLLLLTAPIAGAQPTKSVDRTVTAPQTARWKISDHNATADIRGVHAPLTVETHNGRVHVSDLDGPLRVDAHNGSVTADFVFFRGAEFTSHLGSVELTLHHRRRSTCTLIHDAAGSNRTSRCPFGLWNAARRASMAR